MTHAKWARHDHAVLTDQKLNMDLKTRSHNTLSVDAMTIIRHDVSAVYEVAHCKQPP